MESVQPGEESAVSRHIGPLDEITIGPLRGLLTAKLAAMVVLAVAAIAAAVLLAPQVGTGLGLAPRVSATVTAIEPLPAEDNTASATCTRERVHVVWGANNTGSFLTCGISDSTESTGADGPGMRVSVGDVIAVHAVAGWQSVVIGGRGSNFVVAAVLATVLALSVVGMVRYVRERRAVVALTKAPVTTVALPATRIGYAMAFDALSLGKGKRAMLQMRFEEQSLRPLRLQVPGASNAAMKWRMATVHPVGRTRRGDLAGPYVVETSSGGTLLAAGRRLKKRPAET